MAYRYRRRRTSSFAAPALPRWDMRLAATIAALVLIALLALAGLALLGRSYTFGERVLSWTDWRVQQAGHAYRAELGGLQQDAEILIELLNGRVPDPVRAQIVADQIVTRHGDPLRYATRAGGQPALARHRDLLMRAAAAVEDWAVGATPREAAQQAVDELMAALGEADERNSSR